MTFEEVVTLSKVMAFIYGIITFKEPVGFERLWPVQTLLDGGVCETYYLRVHLALEYDSKQFPWAFTDPLRSYLR